MRAAGPDDGEAGFSLLELLVALALLALGATALVRLNGLSTRTAADLATRTMADITADGVAARAQTDPAAPVVGTTTEALVNGGVPLAVAVTTAPTADPAVVTIAIRVTPTLATGAGAGAGVEGSRRGAVRRLVVRRAGR